MKDVRQKPIVRVKYLQTREMDIHTAAKEGRLSAGSADCPYLEKSRKKEKKNTWRVCRR